MRRLRLQLLGVLALAIVLPLWPAAFAARELFRRSFDPLLAGGLHEGAEAGLALAREAMDAHEARWLAELAAGAPLDTVGTRERLRWRLDERVPGTPRALGARVLEAEPEVVSDDSSATLVAALRGGDGARVWVRRALPDTLARRAAALARGRQLWQAVRLERPAVQRGFELTFLAVYAALAGLVLALGLWLTSRLTRPLADLSDGIRRVAEGDLAARVPVRGDGEVAELVRQFNAMAGRLAEHQEALGRLERLSAWRQAARFLAHEIKNPLTPIQLAAQTLRDAYPGGDERYAALVRESVAIIEEEVLGMRNLVGEFSQFARLPEVRAARESSAELARELTALYGEAQLAVGAGGPLSPLALWCDRDQLKRVLVNLVDNALASQRAAGVTTPVELAFEAAGDGGARVSVRDRGPGVPDERKRRVFEPDFTTKSDGMGLGLAIVEQVVQRHGGRITLHDAPGGGARFELVLPPEPREGVSA